jgi:hypothetical protein
VWCRTLCGCVFWRLSHENKILVWNGNVWWTIVHLVISLCIHLCWAQSHLVGCLWQLNSVMTDTHFLLYLQRSKGLFIVQWPCTWNEMKYLLRSLYRSWVCLTLGNRVLVLLMDVQWEQRFWTNMNIWEATYHKSHFYTIHNKILLLPP